MGKLMRWQNMTTKEIAEVPRNIPLVINIAAIEQHGPHLPLETDAVIGAHFLDQLDRRIPDEVLILPQISVCCSEHHMDFPGTLSVSHETLLNYLNDILSSAVRHGFRSVLIFNSHGGNQAIGQVALEQFGAAQPDCNIVFATWWSLAGPEISKLRESARGGTGHACELETSLMMHIDPRSVRGDVLPGHSNVPTFDWGKTDMLIGKRATLFRTMKETSGGSGIVGDPSLATAEKGQQITDQVLGQLECVVRDLGTL